MRRDQLRELSAARSVRIAQAQQRDRDMQAFRLAMADARQQHAVETKAQMDARLAEETRKRRIAEKKRAIKRVEVCVCVCVLVVL